MEIRSVQSVVVSVNRRLLGGTYTSEKKVIGRWLLFCIHAVWYGVYHTLVIMVWYPS